ncbi:tetratricopeptide repeat protein [Nisaea nitritireducens]|uniref:tetratricopeptide repeat protein n=1 Tax=Nisaea nitritireducens TaxID=568392 RepID=UPI00186707C7|nr:hypothetical protein [Nisaea nitritireducens]
MMRRRYRFGVFFVATVFGLTSFAEAVEAEVNCAKRLNSDFGAPNHISERQPSALIDVEQDNYNRLFKDIVHFRPGHKVTLRVSGQIDVNRRYWEVRKCKWFGLKCWYEPREQSHWKSIGDLHVQTRICPRENEGCQLTPGNIDSPTYEKLHGYPELLPSPDNGMVGAKKSFVLSSRISGIANGGNGVDRGRCTGARPSTCSFGAYSIGTVVDVKPRLDLIGQLLLRKHNSIDDLVSKDFVDDFILKSPSARRVAGCMLYQYTEKYFPEVAGAANQARELLLKHIVELEGDNEYRLALTSLLITSGAIDEALGRAGEDLETARARYEANPNSNAYAIEYSKALLNRGRLWIEDRVATEGADLEIAVGLFEEMVRIRKEIFDRDHNQGRLIEYAEAQIEKARLLSLIRTSDALEQAEISLGSVVEWMPLVQTEEVAGVNASTGEYVGLKTVNVRLLVDTDKLADGVDPRTQPVKTIQVLRLPAAATEGRAMGPHAKPGQAYLLTNTELATEERVWRPASDGMARTWRQFHDASRCPTGLTILDGRATVDAHTIYARNGDGGVYRSATDAAGCVKIGGPDKLPKDSPVYAIPHDRSLLFAGGSNPKGVFYVEKDKQAARKIAEFSSPVVSLHVSVDDLKLFVTTKHDIEGLLVYEFSDLAALGSVTEGTPHSFKIVNPDPSDGVLIVGKDFTVLRRDGSLVRIPTATLSGNLGDTDPTSVNGAEVIARNIESDMTPSVDVAGPDFAVLTFRDLAGEGAEDVGVIEAVIAGKPFRAELTRSEGFGFDATVHLIPGVRRLTRGHDVRVLAKGTNGVLHRTDFVVRGRTAAAPAKAITSRTAAILDQTRIILATAAVEAENQVRNIPMFSGKEIPEVSAFCVANSRWGCSVAPLKARAETPNQDTVLVIARGHDHSNGDTRRSDSVARVTIGLDTGGLPTLVDFTDLSGDFPTLDRLDAESGADHPNPAWRYVAAEGYVASPVSGVLLAALPTESVDPMAPADSDFDSARVFHVPVKWINDSGSIDSTVRLRSPFGLKFLLPGLNADESAVTGLLAATLRSSTVRVYAGDGGMTFLQHDVSNPSGMFTWQVGMDGQSVLVGTIAPSDNTVFAAQMRYDPAEGTFTSTLLPEGHVGRLLNEWTPSEREALTTPFSIVGASPTLDVVWVPVRDCTHVYKVGEGDATMYRALVGRLYGGGHLLPSHGKSRVVFQKPRLTEATEKSTEIGQPHTQRWEFDDSGIFKACNEQ